MGGAKTVLAVRIELATCQGHNGHIANDIHIASNKPAIVSKVPVTDFMVIRMLHVIYIHMSKHIYAIFIFHDEDTFDS